MGADGLDVATAYGIQIGVTVGVFFLFSWLRCTQFARRFYAPKRFDKSVRIKPRRLPGDFSWWRLIYAAKEEDVVTAAGLDAAMFVRVLTFGVEVFVYLSLWCIIVVLPTNLTGTEVQAQLALQEAGPAPAPPPPPPRGLLAVQPVPHALLAVQPVQPVPRRLLAVQPVPRTLPAVQSVPRALLAVQPAPAAPATNNNGSGPAGLTYQELTNGPKQTTVRCYEEPVIETIPRQVSAFDRCSVSNLPSNSPKLWVHVVSLYLATFIVLQILWRYNGEASLLRIMFLANLPRGGASHTVLVTDIPGMKYGTLKWYMRGLVGSTLFVMLPAKLKARLLDWVESGFSAVGSSMELSRAMGRRLGGGLGGGAYEPMAVVATPHPGPDAGELPATSPSSGTASTPPPPRPPTPISPDTRLTLTAEDLSVWWKAQQELGPAANGVGHNGEEGQGESQEERIKGFVRREFEFGYGADKVAAVNPVWEQTRLQAILGELNKVTQNLEDYLDKVAYLLRRRRPIKRLRVTVLGPTLGSWGTAKYGMKPVKVDALEFWSSRTKWLLQELKEAQAVSLRTPIPSAFVTFNTRSAQAHAATSLHSHDETAWRTQPAPDPEEVVWSNLRMRLWERSARGVAMWALYVLLVVFFIIPVIIVQGFVNLSQLATYPVLRDIVNAPFINQLLQGILPSIVLVVFLALVPSILQFMCRLSGYVSISSMDRGVVTRYFYFQLVVVFLYNMVAGSVINQIKYIAANPSSLLNTLGIAVPQTATFFVTFIVTAGIGKTGINFLRLPGLAVFWVLSRMASTARAKSRLWQPQFILYGPVVPNYTIAFFLGMVYCVINPIICPTVLLYFALSILAERYNALYVYRNKYESGGRLWAVVLHQFMVSLYAMQLFAILLLSLKAFRAVAVLAPLVIITFTFHVAVTSLFRRPWSVVSVHDAAMLDAKEQEMRGTTEMTPSELQAIQDMYLSPVFKVHEDEIEHLLLEASVASLRIDGKEVDLEMQEQLAGEGVCDGGRG